MKFVLYTHSLISDWNHGNAHFLRGVCRELVARGHTVQVLEPTGGWSRENLLREQGRAAIDRFAVDFPGLSSRCYGDHFDHAEALHDADVVIVHEWTAGDVVAEIGRIRRGGVPFTLLFHDTHHRAVSNRDAIASLPLGDYDGVLAFGEALRQLYLKAGWGRRVFTWHEAADDRLFRPLPVEKSADLIWIGNWGDGERSKEIAEFLIGPAKNLSLSGEVRGVRYPEAALRALAATRLRYGGWIANADVPVAFAFHKVTLHVPRRPYRQALPGIPTIRVFEALACGIPLVCAPWQDDENLFRVGQDYLVARDGREMTARLEDVLNDPDLALALSNAGRETIAASHTCRHRVDQLLAILGEIGALPAASLQEVAA